MSTLTYDSTEATYDGTSLVELVEDDDYKWTFELEGETFTFGPGTGFEILQIDGLDDISVRTSTRDIPRGDGGVAGSHFLSPKEPVFRCEVLGGQAVVEDLREQWAAGLPHSETAEGQLIFQRPGTARRFFYARVLERRWPTDARHVGLKSEPTVAFEVADPRAYADELRLVTLQPFTAGGGLDFPVTDYPKEYTVTGNTVAATNGGNAPSPPLIRFFGPSSGTCTGVELINETTGVTLDVDTSLTSGQTLTVDMRAYVAATGDRVVDKGGANDFGSWQTPREALLIAPGSNVLRFEAEGGTDDMEAAVSWRDAWT